MLSRAWLEVDLGAVVRNAAALQHHAGVPLIPMIKADAYGLGAAEIAHALEALSPLAYGVATVAEGEELRSVGIKRRILIFTPILAEEFEPAHSANLTPALGSAAEIEAWRMYGGPYHLSIDTGMSRAGIPWREIRSVVEIATVHPPEGAFTHFHSAQLDDGSMSEQTERFHEAIESLTVRPPILHTDNSAAIVRNERSRWDAVRPGIFMYGIGSGANVSLQPECVVHVKARITELRWIEAGDTVSYDATYRAPSRRLIATVPIGYADGYPRAASNLATGIVRERSVPIAGLVTMDMIMFDVTDTGAQLGDIATLVGSRFATGLGLDVEAVASLARLSPYEVLTGLRGRLPRIYTGQLR